MLWYDTKAWVCWISEIPLALDPLNFSETTFRRFNPYLNIMIRCQAFYAMPCSFKTWRHEAHQNNPPTTLVGFRWLLVFSRVLIPWSFDPSSLVNHRCSFLVFRLHLKICNLRFGTSSLWPGIAMTVGISRGYEPGRVLLILPTTDIGQLWSKFGFYL